MVKALVQFPYPYKLGDEQKLGIVKGMRTLCNHQPIYSEEERAVELTIITHDNKETKIKVVANNIIMEIFLHELSPDYGKYKFWHSVLLFPVFDKMPPEGDVYWIPGDIDIVGRCFINDHDKNNISYDNEMYYR